ncbi:hypothetical protein HDU76_011158, partial [Blyttiomyces sp. JEL0837]
MRPTISIISIAMAALAATSSAAPTNTTAPSPTPTGLIRGMQYRSDFQAAARARSVTPKL